MDIEVLLESFDGAFATNTLRDYRKADNGRYQKISSRAVKPITPQQSTHFRTN